MPGFPFHDHLTTCNTLILHYFLWLVLKSLTFSTFSFLLLLHFSQKNFIFLILKRNWSFEIEWRDRKKLKRKCSLCVCVKRNQESPAISCHAHCPFLCILSYSIFLGLQDYPFSLSLFPTKVLFMTHNFGEKRSLEAFILLSHNNWVL